MTEPKENSPRGPLAGVRVLDLTRVLAGPFCTMILADLGADVVKIERPGVGDDARQFGPFLPGGESAYFASINRGKRSVTLDLKLPLDRQTFLKLVPLADVVVENFRPGTMENLGLSAATLREINPRLIYASASGFGRTDVTGRAAYDIIIQALSGLMSITGTDHEHPVRVGTSISDILTGLFTTIGILAALGGRERHGGGADLDLAMLDCTVAALENALSRYHVTGVAPQPMGTRHPSIAPFQAFQTADAPIVVAAGNDALWQTLCEVLDAPELADDARLATNALRVAHLDLLEELLNARFGTQPAAAWLAKLEEQGVPAAPIHTLADVMQSPALASRGMLHTMQIDDQTQFLTAGSPLRIDGAAPRISSRAPKLGEHTTAVLREWLAM